MIFLCSTSWRISTASLLLFCFALLLSRRNVTGLAVGDEICAEGFIMDEFCIVLGTLLDNPNVKTLENPGVHSLHCLLDITSCRESHYIILQDPISNTSVPPYSAGYQVDDAGKELLIRIGRAVGKCSTCMTGGSQLRGFRAEVQGTITELGSGINGSHKLNVTSARASFNLTSVCQSAGGPTPVSSPVAGSSPVTAPVNPPGNDRFSLLGWFLDLFSRVFNLFS